MGPPLGWRLLVGVCRGGCSLPAFCALCCFRSCLSQLAVVPSCSWLIRLRLPQSSWFFLRSSLPLRLLSRSCPSASRCRLLSFGVLRFWCPFFLLFSSFFSLWYSSFLRSLRWALLLSGFCGVSLLALFFASCCLPSCSGRILFTLPFLLFLLLPFFCFSLAPSGVRFPRLGARSPALPFSRPACRWFLARCFFCASSTLSAFFFVFGPSFCPSPCFGLPLLPSFKALAARASGYHFWPVLGHTPWVLAAVREVPSQRCCVMVSLLVFIGSFSGGGLLLIHVFFHRLLTLDSCFRDVSLCYDVSCTRALCFVCFLLG